MDSKVYISDLLYEFKGNVGVNQRPFLLCVSNSSSFDDRRCFKLDTRMKAEFMYLSKVDIDCPEGDLIVVKRIDSKEGIDTGLLAVGTKLYLITNSVELEYGLFT